MSFSIDGLEWQYPCQITREAKLTASDISGMMLDKSYFNDCGALRLGGSVCADI